MDLTVNSEVLKAIGAAGSLEEIRAAAITEAAKQQTAAEADAAAKAEADRQAAAQKTQDDADTVYSITETINGREFEFTAASPEELSLMVLNARRVADAVRQDPVAPQVQQVKEIVPAKTAAEVEAERVALEVAFRNGTISAKDYIEQSGAVGEYLASQGLSVEALKHTVESTQARATIQSWEEAAEAFKQGAGADWPGGNRNKKLLGNKLHELGLEDAEDKVQALNIAYNALKQEDMLFENELIQHEKTTVTQTPTTAAPVTHATTTQPTTVARTQQKSSSIFGASNGVTENTTKTAADAQPTFSIDPNAHPQEIMAAWKAKMAEQQIDPNAAFVETFGARRK